MSSESACSRSPLNTVPVKVRRANTETRLTLFLDDNEAVRIKVKTHISLHSVHTHTM